MAAVLKALITGGYLILKQPNPGLVVATTSRFYTTAEWIQVTPDSDANANANATVDANGTTVRLPVVVVSPQFKSTTTFELALDTSTGALTVAQQFDSASKQTPPSEENLYLSSPIRVAMRALSVLEPEHFAKAVKRQVEAGKLLKCTLEVSFQ